MRWSGTNRPVLVIGYGNSLRRDDGAGLILSQALVDLWQAQSLPASLITSHQLAPEQAEDIALSGADIVVFVDARIAEPFSNKGIETNKIESVQSTPRVGHQLTPAALMLYASQLYAFKGSGWIISIPGADFNHGEGLCAETQLLVDEYLAQGLEIWNQLQASIAKEA